MKISRKITLLGLGLAVGIILGVLISINIINSGIIYFGESSRTISSFTPTSVKTYCAWFPWWHETQALSALRLAKNTLHTISPVWYRVDSDGYLEPLKVTMRNEVTDIATVSGIRLAPTIGNDFDNNRIELVLTNASKSAAIIEQIVDIAKIHLYDGIDLDWEEILPKNSDLLHQFIKTLADKLHHQNRFLSVTVHAKTGDSDWDMAKTYDWSELSKYADEIRIMAYDFHTELSPPGPITPLDALKSVINYAQKTIPPEKITIGLPNYGYDWSDTNNLSVSFTDAEVRMDHYNGIWIRDPQSYELIGTYENNDINHTIYLVDNVSLREKIDISHKSGINSICLWRLGEEDPEIWSINNELPK
ncbi:hypothetical protein A2154_01645 [Candidatus Gottesmanbacteria bacterium RBG_16_43_7]|uniref:GH18 domain-containing protein n=1 Tax=Candidatus Gottesmanbacteria bacterium RBG_16_43_7 TaxID=1798373 RepID=A0A1F5ZBU2_9BACT|nr:MAG: hypothetical protein A2154_01645 [Candidatus Gottesmanbacteria bacterium RBG_16_43_7]